MDLIPWRSQNLTKKNSTIGEQVRQGGLISRQAWEFVVAASNAYQEALDLNDEDIVTMERLDGYIVVMLPEHRRVYIVAKCTCGCPYGGTWATILQARLQDYPDAWHRRRNNLHHRALKRGSRACA